MYAKHSFNQPLNPAGKINFNLMQAEIQLGIKVESMIIHSLSTIYPLIVHSLFREALDKVWLFFRE